MATRKKTTREDSRPKAPKAKARAKAKAKLKPRPKPGAGAGTKVRAAVRSPLPEGDRFVVLMEQMQEQNRATIEAVTSLEQRMNARFDEMDRKSGLRFESVEAAIRLNSDAIRKNSEDIRKNSEDIRLLAERMDEFGSKIDALTRRVERLEELLGMKADAADVSRLEERVRRLEERLGVSVG
jgi:chromosome segregation ATPase